MKVMYSKREFLSKDRRDTDTLIASVMMYDAGYGDASFRLANSNNEGFVLHVDPSNPKSLEGCEEKVEKIMECLKLWKMAIKDAVKEHGYKKKTNSDASLNRY